MCVFVWGGGGTVCLGCTEPHKATVMWLRVCLSQQAAFCELITSESLGSRECYEGDERASQLSALTPTARACSRSCLSRSQQDKPTVAAQICMSRSSRPKSACLKFIAEQGRGFGLGRRGEVNKHDLTALLRIDLESIFWPSPGSCWSLIFQESNAIWEKKKHVCPSCSIQFLFTTVTTAILVNVS